MKECNKCGETKPLEAFHKHNKCKDGRIGACRVCRSKWLSAYRKAKGWRVRGEDPLYKKAQRASLRRARIRNQLCECCSQKDLAQMYEIRPEGCEVDHMIPISKGGLHCLSNLQFLPMSLNRAKADKLGY